MRALTKCTTENVKKPGSFTEKVSLGPDLERRAGIYNQRKGSDERGAGKWLPQAEGTAGVRTSKCEIRG